MKFGITSAVVLTLAAAASAQTPATAPATRPAAAARDRTPAVPTTLPGNGLAQHDFFYAGEAKQRRMFIVRKGQIAWSYDDPAGRGEISDATLLSDGDVLFASQFAVRLIGPDKTVKWQYDAPKGAEVHTAVPIGTGHVLFVQNGNPAFVRVVAVPSGETVKEFNVEVKNPASVHGQFRHARLTAAGTLILAHMDLGKVNEYDADGKVLRTIDAPGVWGATPLKNGNLLIVEGSGINEVDPAGKTVWSLARADLRGYRLPSLQLAWRLANGNTLLGCWINQWNGPVNAPTAPAQAVEVTPDKQVVWALHSYADPDLGPATTIQVLDEPDKPEQVSFGDIH